MAEETTPVFRAWSLLSNSLKSLKHSSSLDVSAERADPECLHPSSKRARIEAATEATDDVRELARRVREAKGAIRSGRKDRVAYLIESSEKKLTPSARSYLFAQLVESGLTDVDEAAAVFGARGFAASPLFLTLLLRPHEDPRQILDSPRTRILSALFEDRDAVEALLHMDHVPLETLELALSSCLAVSRPVEAETQSTVESLLTHASNTVDGMERVLESYFDTFEVNEACVATARLVFRAARVVDSRSRSEARCSEWSAHADERRRLCGLLSASALHESESQYEDFFTRLLVDPRVATPVGMKQLLSSLDALLPFESFRVLSVQRSCLNKRLPPHLKKLAARAAYSSRVRERLEESTSSAALSAPNHVVDLTSVSTRVVPQSGVIPREMGACLSALARSLTTYPRWREDFNAAKFRLAMELTEAVEYTPSVDGEALVCLLSDDAWSKLSPEGRTHGRQLMKICGVRECERVTEFARAGLARLAQRPQLPNQTSMRLLTHECCEDARSVFLDALAHASLESLDSALRSLWIWVRLARERLDALGHTVLSWILERLRAWSSFQESSGNEEIQALLDAFDALPLNPQTEELTSRALDALFSYEIRCKWGEALPPRLMRFPQDDSHSALLRVLLTHDISSPGYARLVVYALARAKPTLTHLAAARDKLNGDFEPVYVDQQERAAIVGRARELAHLLE